MGYKYHYVLFFFATLFLPAYLFDIQHWTRWPMVIVCALLMLAAIGAIEKERKKK
jgi:hypothetical protein